MPKKDPERLTKPDIQRSGAIFNEMDLRPTDIGGFKKTGNLAGEWLTVTIPKDYIWGNDIKVHHHLNYKPEIMLVEGGYPLIKGVTPWTRNEVYVMVRTIIPKTPIRFMVM